MKLDIYLNYRGEIATKAFRFYEQHIGGNHWDRATRGTAPEIALCAAS